MNILSKNKKKGFSLAEILISALILVIVSAGFFASFVAANRFINRSKRHMAAVNLGRQISENLYSSVRADTWNNGSNVLACEPNLYPCNKEYALPNATIGVPTIENDNPLKDFPNLKATLTIAASDPVTSARSVSVAISWDE